MRIGADEIGIRMAVGAARGHIVRRYVRRGLGLGLAGAALGLVGSASVTGVMSSLLYGVSTTDVTSFSIATSLVLDVALAAALVPAWRAARVDPVIALRHH